MRTHLVLALALAGIAFAFCSGCTVVKPVACAVVFPFHQFGEKLDRSVDDESDDYRELPTAGVVATAPVLIPLNYIYYTLYGAVGGLVSGVINDLNILTGHGNLENTRSTLYEPMQTNAIDPDR